MASAGRAVQIDQRGLAGRTGVAIGHAHHHRLVQAHDIGEGQGLQHRQLGAARIAEQAVHAEMLEYGESGFAHG